MVLTLWMSWLTFQRSVETILRETSSEKDIATPAWVDGVASVKVAPRRSLGGGYLRALKWLPYNPSILRLPAQLWQRLCHGFFRPGSDECQMAVYAISWYSRIPGAAFGTKVFLGFLEESELGRLLHSRPENSTLAPEGEASYLVEPTFVQNILGPKAADPRLFTLTDTNGIERLAMISYTLIGRRAPGRMAMDYHVRVSILEVMPRQHRLALCENRSAGCKPDAALDRNLMVGETTVRVSCCAPAPRSPPLGELFVDCSVDPQACRSPYAPHGGTTPVELPGVEVQMLPGPPITRKNVQPVLQPRGLGAGVTLVVDTSSTDSGRPLMVAIDSVTGSYIRTWNFTMAGSDTECANFLEGGHRGSTQFLPLDEHGLYVTVTHKQQARDGGLHYLHYLFLFQSAREQVALGSSTVDVLVPRVCLRQMGDPLYPPPSRFHFAVGLAHFPQSPPQTDYRLVVTYGWNNAHPYANLLSITPPKDLPAHLTAAPPSLPDTVPMASITVSKEPFDQFFTMWIGVQLSGTKLALTLRLFDTIHAFHPQARLYFLTGPNVLPKEIQAEMAERRPWVHVVWLDIPWIVSQAKSEGMEIHSDSWQKAHPRELGDVVRVIALYLWGGTWVDGDDGLLRPFGLVENALPIIEWPDVVSKDYWGTRFTLIPGTLGYKWAGLPGAGAPYEQSNVGNNWNVQNEPLVNWHRGHDFLRRWVSCMTDPAVLPKDFGQLCPTNAIYHANSNLIGIFNATPQHHLIVHPAFAYQAGYLNNKGPLFPPYDFQAIDECPLFGVAIIKTVYLHCLRKILRTQYFGSIKSAKGFNAKTSQNAASSEDGRLGFQDWSLVIPIKELVAEHRSACRDGVSQRHPHLSSCH